MDWSIKTYYGLSFLIKVRENPIPILEQTSFYHYLSDLIRAQLKIKSEQTLTLIKRIKVSANYFDQLREILAEHELSSKQIKEKINLLKKKIKKLIIRYPKLKVILKRLKKYERYLYHAYDKESLPFTNLGIERYFKNVKRRLRKRIGARSRGIAIITTGELFFLFDQIISQNKDLWSEESFINYFRSKRPLINAQKHHQLTKSFHLYRTQLKKQYTVKIDSNHALKLFTTLKKQISQN